MDIGQATVGCVNLSEKQMCCENGWVSVLQCALLCQFFKNSFFSKLFTNFQVESDNQIFRLYSHILYSYLNLKNITLIDRLDKINDYKNKNGSNYRLCWGTQKKDQTSQQGL